MTENADSIARARAYVDRVLMSLHGDIPRLSDVRTVAELEDALSALDQLGYQVEGRSARRGSLRSVEEELIAASAELGELRHEFDRNRLAASGRHVEDALGFLRWRVQTPESPVLRRVFEVVEASARSARPLAEAISRIREDLPSGPLSVEAEQRRAVETAFIAAGRWLPLVAAAAGDADAGRSLEHLQGSQARYLAEFVRQQYSTFPDGARDAVTFAADALDASAALTQKPRLPDCIAIGERAAQVMRVLVDLRGPTVTDELTWLVETVGVWPLRVPLRDLT
jgi:hypothetical protein